MLIDLEYPTGCGRNRSGKNSASDHRRIGILPGEGRVIVTEISTRNCVQSAVMGFSVRDYHVYVPMDCTAQKDEKEVLQAFSLFTSFGYRHNVTMTRSELIRLE